LNLKRSQGSFAGKHLFFHQNCGGLVKESGLEQAETTDDRENLLRMGFVRTRQRWIGSLIVMLVILGVVSIFISYFCIPKFEHLFYALYGGQPMEMFGGKPLPELTEWIFSNRIPLIIASVIWPLLGILLVWRLKLASVLWHYLPFVLSIGQILITLYAFSLPMVSPMVGAPISHS